MPFAAQTPRDRALSIAAVLAVHGLVLVVLLALPPRLGGAYPEVALDIFDVAIPASPPSRPAPRVSVANEGRAAPANLRASPSEVVAPRPALALPPPNLTAAPVAANGAAPSAGAAEVPGPGTGAGGVGDGLGSGTGGSRTGSGGIAARASLLRGTIRNGDYPRAARRDRIEGVVTVEFTVAPDGRPRGCSVARSSGNAELDATTCRLIETRFFYAPARNAAGDAVSEQRGWQQRWWLEGRRAD